jgi:hypothetical protein
MQHTLHIDLLPLSEPQTTCRWLQIAESLQLDGLTSSALKGIANLSRFSQFKTLLRGNSTLMSDLHKLSSSTLAHVLYCSHVCEPYSRR